MDTEDRHPIGDMLGDRRHDERRKGEVSFKRWKRNTVIAFAFVVAMSSFGLWWVSDTRSTQEKKNREFTQQIAGFATQLAKYVGGETLGACQDVNELRAGIRNVLERSRSNLIRLAKTGQFPADQVAEQLHQINQGIAKFKAKTCDHTIPKLPDGAKP